MPSEIIVRRSIGVRIIFAVGLLYGAHLFGQAPSAKTSASEPKASKPEIFTAVTANLTSSSGEKLRIQVFRWSTDQDREKLLAALKEKGAEQLGPALQTLPESGYIWAADESLGYTVRYAYREVLHSGGERIILATDRPLGSWSGHPWTTKLESNSVTYPYSVMELVLNGSGRGEGKMSLNSKVVANESGKTIALENSESSPAVLKNVQGPTDHSKN